MTNGVKTTRAWMVCACAAAVALGACSKDTPAPAESKATASAVVGANGEKYPAPRWPSYFKTPTSTEELMPAGESADRRRRRRRSDGD